MNKFVISVFIAMGLVVLGPREEAKADALTGVLIGAGIGALAGLIYAVATIPPSTDKQSVSPEHTGGTTNTSVSVPSNQNVKKNKWDERGN